MNIWKYLYIALLLLSVSTRSFAQQYSNYREKMLSREQLIRDYSILYATLTNYHPAPFMYTPETEFKAFYEAQAAAFPDSLSERAFHILVRHLIVQLKCGHTVGKPSDAWYQSLAGKKVLLPFEIKRVGEQVYISNTTEDNNELQVNDELLRINGIAIQDILQQMADIQERDGLTQSFVAEGIIKRFRTYYLFLYGMPEQIAIEYKRQQGEVRHCNTSLSLNKLRPLPAPALPPALKPIYQNNWSVFAIDTQTRLAYLKIRSFSDRKSYKAYYKQVFKAISEQQCTALILDIRDNGGGFFKNGHIFLRYLSPEKFEFNFQRPIRKITKNEYTSLGRISKMTKRAFALKPQKHRYKGQRTYTFSYKPHALRFKGKVHVLQNGITFSQAALVSAHLRAHNARFWGAESGGTESGTNAMLNYKLVLPNSGIQVQIPYYRMVSNSTGGTFGFGVKADVPIAPGLDNSRDEVLYKVIEGIKR
jgi:hypothetical protein